MNQEPHYTLFLVPDRSAKLWRLRFPAWIMHGSFWLLGLVGVLAAVMAWDYVSVLSHVEENRNLRQNQRDLQARIQQFDRRMQQVEQQMLRVQALSDRLRMMLQLDTDAFEAEGLYLPQGIQTPDWPNWKPTKDKHSRLFPRAQPAFDLESLLRDLSLQERASLSLEQRLQDELEALMDQRAFLRALPTRAPAEGLFTSGFGVRSSPLGGGAVKMHEGLDIANHPGTPIRAPAYGEVVFADIKAGYGLTIILDHGYGIETWYGHLRKSLVRKGMKVDKGNQLALMGSSGRSTGPHVHYEVRVNGTPVDPRTFIIEADPA